MHTIGSPPILDALLRTLIAAGARLAEPGEFTLRAFLAGRIDLTQAEAVLGVIDARDRAELQTALEQLAGGLGSPLHRLREDLLQLLAHLEAGLDFVEEDIEFISREQLDSDLGNAARQIEEIVEQTGSRNLADSAYPIVLRGLPNVGKSSLLNALCGTDAAIVSEQAGTTRDYVAAEVDIGGLACLLIDTAGVEPPTDDGIQAAAQRAAVRQHLQSRIELLCIDASRDLEVWEREQLAQSSDMRIVVATKADQPREAEIPSCCEVIDISSQTGFGLADLRVAIRGRIERLYHRDSAIVGDTAVRCLDSLQAAAESLQRAREAASLELGEELVAAEIRIALDELGRVTGAVHTDDVLDRIFSRFCIGK
ncbi:MAG: 50S ribosome-binding GTPase [Planctomycetales bacterium]|nr:50S ribosome-binding GTPase [Planctomycetales bacterium]